MIIVEQAQEFAGCLFVVVEGRKVEFTLDYLAGMIGKILAEYETLNFVSSFKAQSSATDRDVSDLPMALKLFKTDKG